MRPATFEHLRAIARELGLPGSPLRSRKGAVWTDEGEEEHLVFDAMTLDDAEVETVADLVAAVGNYLREVP